MTSAPAACPACSLSLVLVPPWREGNKGENRLRCIIGPLVVFECCFGKVFDLFTLVPAGSESAHVQTEAVCVYLVVSTEQIDPVS